MLQLSRSRSVVASSSLFVIALVVTTYASQLRAQCIPQWQPGLGAPGTNGPVRSMTNWDPDGAGPLTPRIAAAGYFTLAGNTVANGVAAFDPATDTWSPLGTGIAAMNQLTGVRALAAGPSGALFAGGYFSTAGGVAASNVAVWQNGAWAPLGTGTGGVVKAAVVMPNGDLIVGGPFSHAGGVPVYGLARWNGTSWSAVVGAPNLHDVTALAVRADGTLFVGGTLAPTAIGSPVVASWDGSTWTVLATVTQTAIQVHTMLVLPNGRLVVGGLFNDLMGSGAHHLAQWDGTAWSVLGGFPNAYVFALCVLTNGDVVATGAFQQFWVGSQVPTENIARWNGTTWSPCARGMVSGQGAALAALPNGEFLVGGGINLMGNLPTQNVFTQNVARWTGTAWTRVGSGFGGPVRTVLPLPGNDWLAGGEFMCAGDVDAIGVARWDGSAWRTMGAGVFGTAWTTTTLPNGDIVVAGAIPFVPGQPSATNLVARWDGTTWHAMGGSLNGDVYASARLPNGDIVVGGAFTAVGGVATGTVARWNGTSWVALGTGTTGLVRALAVLPNGHLVAGGTVISAGGQTVVGLARWDGTMWSPLGTGVPNVRALAALPDGTLMAASAASMFTTSPNQTKLWNGSYWWNLGAPADAEIDVLLPLHDGAVIAAGRFTSIGGVVAPHLARWNGAAWSAIAGGTSGPIHAVAAKPSGELAIGGNFATANGAVATHFVRVVNPCPPGAVVSGAGCPSSGGANVLEVLSPAYLGSTFRARGTGLPSLALVSVITGFTPISVPLAALLSQGVAGCNLLVSPDHLYFAVAEAGTVTTAIPLPSSMALVGLSFFHQLNPVEVDASLNIVAVTASNALQLTTGWF